MFWNHLVPEILNQIYCTGQIFSYNLALEILTALAQNILFNKSF